MGFLTSIFDFLFGETDHNKECLQFTKSLCDKIKPKISESWLGGYTYNFVLLFDDNIEITLKYNYIRKEWDMQIWSKKASSFLYYYDVLSTPPTSTMNYLIDRYRLCCNLDVALKKKQQEKDKATQAVRDIKSQFLGG